MASDLRAIGCDVKVQEDFQQGKGALLQKLERVIAETDRVILLVGDAYGVEAAGEDMPENALPCSYTQWEYYLAKGQRLDGSSANSRALYIYFASQQYLSAHPVEEPESHTEKQKRFREELLQSGTDYGMFDTVESLCRAVLRDAWQMESRPKRVYLPESIGTLFHGREGFMRDLHKKILARLDPNGRATVGEIKQAIAGLGGVGKTRFAIEYAHRYKDDYTALLFVLADTTEHLRRGLGELVGPLALDIREAQGSDLENKVSAALRWLMEHPGWLLIFDNVDTEEAASAIENLVSRLYGGHILITTRLKNWSASVDPLYLDVLDEQAATTFLLERTERTRDVLPNDPAVALALAQRLDGLALALEQAGAYIASAECSLKEYLSYWEKGNEEVLKWYDKRLMKYPRSIATTWEITMQTVGPVGRALLRVASFFSPEPIPEEMLTNGAELIDHALRSSGVQSEISVSRLKIAIGELAKFSMLKKIRTNNCRCCILHRVVIDVTCKQLPVENMIDWLRCAQEVFCAYAPADADRFENWDTWNLLITHGERIWDQVKKIEEEQWNPALLDGLSLYYLGQERNEDGVTLQRRSLALKEKKLGSKHPNTLLAMNDLAIMLQNEEGISLLEKTLLAREEVHGPLSEEALETAYNLALLLPNSSHADRSEELFQRCFEGYSKSHGRTHWRTLLVERSLCSRMFLRGEIEEALKSARRIVDMSDQEPSLGPMHKDTLEYVFTLGQYLFQSGDIEAARRIFKRAFEGMEEQLSPRHPSTLESFQWMMEAVYKLGKSEEVETQCRQILDRWSHVLGADHIHTITVAQILVKMLALQGRIKEARFIEIDIHLSLNRNKYYTIQVTHGSEHEEVFEAMKNYADTLRDSGNYDEANRMYIVSIDGLKRFKGSSNEVVAIALNNYGLLLRDKGDLEFSLKSYMEALDIDQQIREPNDPKIAHRMNNVSMVLMMMDRLAEAKLMTSDAWNVKGTNHDVTSGRILWVRLAINLLESTSIDLYLGQLKSLVSKPEVEQALSVTDYWNVESVIDNLATRLNDNEMELLTSLWQYFNNRSHFHVQIDSSEQTSTSPSSGLYFLNDLKIWHDQQEISLDEAWPIREK